jgi:1,2-dihydroxy-3-keto-5-methylthiopentene dioxygenase
MTLLTVWKDDDPAAPLRQTTDPVEIAFALQEIGCRFDRRDVRPDVLPDADQEAVLASYRDVVDEIVAAEGFVTVDVASIRPSDDPGWPETAKAVRAKFIDEHTHGDDDEVRFIIRGAGVFYLHVGDRVHAIYCEAGDLTGVPRGTTHWFDTGAVPDFTAIRFFHDPRGWVGIPTGSDISTRFPDFEQLRSQAVALTR